MSQPATSSAYEDDFERELRQDVLIEAIAKGRLVPVLGGDINLCGRPIEDGTPVSWERVIDGLQYPPSTCELAKYLLDQAKKRDLDPEIRKIIDALAGQLQNPNDSLSAVGLANACQYLKFASPLILQGLLPKLLSREYYSTPVHDFLVRLAQYEPAEDYPEKRPYPCIVTTCYDQVLEQQLRKNKVPFHLVAYVLGRQGGEFQYTPPTVPGAPSAAARSVDWKKFEMEPFKKHAIVIKLNGGSGSDSAVTEDHYIDYLSHQNVKESLHPMLLAKLITRGRTDSSHLLFLGYSPRNWSLRVILRRIWSESLENQNKRWTVLLEEQSGKVDRKFWDQYSLEAGDIQVTGSLDADMKALAAGIEKLRALASPQPPPKDPTIVSKPRRDGIFFSYSHTDADALKELTDMLAPVAQKLNIWHDRMIEPGAKWRDEINEAIGSAKAAVLLVSPAFLKSDFIEKDELPPLLEAASKDGCRILWIAVRESLVDVTDIGAYQALYPRALMNLSTEERNKAISEIAHKIFEIMSK
jgi:hypothetical protein